MNKAPVDDTGGVGLAASVGFTDTAAFADTGTTTNDGGRAPMSRFRFDPMALIAGLVFTGIALAYILRAAGAVSVSAPWSLAAAAIGLGLAGLAGALWAMVPWVVGSSRRRGVEGVYAAGVGDVTPPRSSTGKGVERTPEPPVNPHT